MITFQPEGADSGVPSGAPAHAPAVDQMPEQGDAAIAENMEAMDALNVKPSGARFWRPRFADVDGVRLCYRLAGTGEPILLLHGFRGSGRYWTAVAGELAYQHLVIAPDMKGFGESAKPHSGYSLADHAATLRGLLKTLGVSSVAVVGHSLGGIVALRLLTDFPELVRRIALVATPFTGTIEQNLGELARAPLWMRLLVIRPHLARWIVGLRSKTVVRLGSDTHDLTREAIEDAVKFCWASLHDTFVSCIVRDNMRS
ncbi:MAG: alpha/beta fold hydrolase, partial [Chloroflexi bacterium]|nr:alpha/beta fold hydrolase [Chloroflexota bacterium]